MNKRMTVARLQAGLIEHDNGVLRCGAHGAGTREFCALEFSSIMRDKPFSDSPSDMPDIRALNDAFGTDDAARTVAMLPLMAAYWDWSLWSRARQQATAKRIVIETVRQIVAHLPGLTYDIVAQCAAVRTLDEAERAASMASMASMARAASVASAASKSHRYTVLNTAITLWIDAANSTEGM